MYPCGPNDKLHPKSIYHADMGCGAPWFVRMDGLKTAGLFRLYAYTSWHNAVSCLLALALSPSSFIDDLNVREPIHGSPLPQSHAGAPIEQIIWETALFANILGGAVRTPPPVTAG